MKKKVLVSVLACAMLFLGMGYAYWTDSLQVDTKVTTGELDVKFVDLALFGQYADEEGWAIFDGIGGDGHVADWYFQRDPAAWNNKDAYNIIATDADLAAYNARIEGYTETNFGAELVGNGTLGKNLGANDYISTTKSSDTIDITINKMYPGYAQMFRADIVNPGTLAAKLSKLCITKSFPNSQMGNMIGVSLDVLRESHTNSVVNLLDGVEAADKFTIDGRTFVRLSALATNIDVVENNLLSLYPANTAAGMNANDWRMDLLLGVAMDPDAEGLYTSGSCDNYSGINDGLTQWKAASFKIKFCWDQFNTPTGGQPQ